jgi:small conductance mechanosensitive channel
MLLLFKPYRQHEYIEVGDYAGHVAEFGVFSTTLKTLDNASIIIPNRYVSDHPNRNWSVNGTRRVDLEIENDINADLEKAGQAMLEQDERILKDPAAVVAVSAYGDTAARFIVRPWCQHDRYWEVRYALPEKLKAVVEAAGYAMPTPQRDIQFIKQDQT